MKDLKGLIKSTVKNNTASDEVINEKSLTDKLFEIADKVSDTLEKNHKPKQKKVELKNITFSLSLDAEDILNEQMKRYRIKTGEVAYKSHILIAAINLIAQLNDNDFVNAVSKHQYAKMGRPS